MAKDHDETVEDLNDKEKENEDLEDLDLEDEEEEEDDGDDDKDEDDEDDEDDGKAITKKDLKDFRSNIQKDIDKRFISKRHDKKSKKPYQTPNRKGKDDGEKPWQAEINGLKQAEQKRQFGYENKLSPKEVDLVFRFDKNPSAKTLKNPFVVGGLERMRALENADENTPSGSSRKPVKFNGKDWKDMKEDERQNSFQERRRQILKSKGR